jgi:hypothetical protein
MFLKISWFSRATPQTGFFSTVVIICITMRHIYVDIEMLVLDYFSDTNTEDNSLIDSISNGIYSLYNKIIVICVKL